MGKSLCRKIFFSHWFIFFPLEWLESGERRADILLLCHCLPTFPTTEKISPGRVLEASLIARTKDSATCWCRWVGLSIKLSSHVTQSRFHCVAHRYHNGVSYVESPQGAFEAQLFLIIPELTSQSRRKPTSTRQENEYVPRSPVSCHGTSRAFVGVGTSSLPWRRLPHPETNS